MMRLALCLVLSAALLSVTLAVSAPLGGQQQTLQARTPPSTSSTTATAAATPTAPKPTLAELKAAAALLKLFNDKASKSNVADLLKTQARTTGTAAVSDTKKLAYLSEGTAPNKKLTLLCLDEGFIMSAVAHFSPTAGTKVAFPLAEPQYKFDVHTFYYERLKDTKGLPESPFDGVSEANIYGHGVGGGIAAALSLAVLNKSPEAKIKMITFGAPAVGGLELWKLFKESTKITCFSVQLNKDPVPKCLYQPYYHLGIVVPITKGGFRFRSILAYQQALDGTTQEQLNTNADVPARQTQMTGLCASTTRHVRS